MIAFVVFILIIAVICLSIDGPALTGKGER